MTVHRLKTINHFFDAVADGRKTFEVRLNDRAFQTGDVLELICVSGDLHPTGERLLKRVTYLLQGGQFGIDPCYCVMGLGECVQ